MGYYVKHRIRYDDRLILRISKEACLTSSHRVLDLGCGPGFVANQLAPFARETIGVDPSKTMLDAARAEADALGLDNVDYRLGSSFDLSIVDGPFQLVTMGRSFHWMDRPATLLQLEELIAEDGAIVLLSDSMYDAPENEWWRRFTEIFEDFQNSDDFMPRRKGWEPHVSLLIRSAFSDVQQFSLFAHHRWTVDDVIGLALSRSNMTDSKLGPKRDSFVAAVRQSLTPFVVDDHLCSLVEQTTIMARRPK
ncbi:MAG: class I SAM-dependent methyltransferase [Geminicoccaceae bacterium]